MPDFRIVLERLPSWSIAGTFGTWTMPDGYVFFSLEQEWKDNEPFVSCIPVGTYVMKRIQSPKFGDTFVVIDVPGRDHIEVHSMATEEDSEGCIGLGTGLGITEVQRDQDTGKRAKKLCLTGSRVAITKFLAKMGSLQQATLIVKWAE